MILRCSRLAGWPSALVLCAAIASPAASAPAAALGPEVAVGEPSGGYVGRLDVTPAHAPVGAPVTVAAAGLPPDQEFQVVWITATGAWKVTAAEYRGREFIGTAASPRGSKLVFRSVEPILHGASVSLVADSERALVYPAEAIK